MALDREALRRYFLQGCKAPNDLKIGVEWEKIGVYRDTGQAIRYSGPRGVKALFRALEARYGWKQVLSGGKPIALTKGNASITLEPGGQIELSGQKASSLSQNAFELFSHLRQIQNVSEPLGIAWLGTGVQPISRAKDIEWVPKKRYSIMRLEMAKSGTLSHRMMKETASIQVSLDYTSEKDAGRKLRLATALSPFIGALFANSPVSGGRLNGFYSERSHIWRHTAPERSGFVAAVLKPRFSFEDYVEFALQVPMFFIIRRGRWIPMKGRLFEDFMKKGAGKHTATLEDWVLHLTTIFTECRLKTYIEIRSADCQKMVLGLSVPALIKGIFYDKISLEKTERLVEGFTATELNNLLKSTPKEGLKAKWRGKSILPTAQQIVQLAHAGLTRLGEKKYLEPLEKLALKGLTPSDEVRRNFNRKKIVQLLSL